MNTTTTPHPHHPPDQPYRPIRTAGMNHPSLSAPPLSTIPTDWDWPRFWTYVHRWMKDQGYAHSTARLYRQVLRNFARVAGTPPASVTRSTVNEYLGRLGRGHCSAHWAALNHSTLRTVFDKLFGIGLLDHRPGPRRPDTLPHILSHQEAISLLGAATTLRDRLLIGLLYGCGLTVGELRGLRWRDLDPANRAVHAPGNLRTLPRILLLPDALLPLVGTARSLCPADALVFPGHTPNQPLTARWIQHLVRETARRSGILKPVSPICLRHTYAVHRLEANTNIRELQTALGHRSVRTTLRYTRCLVPPEARSPLDADLPSPPHASSPTPPQTLSQTDVAAVSVLAAFATSASEFIHTLGAQLGWRLLAFRKPTTDPP